MSGILMNNTKTSKKELMKVYYYKGEIIKLVQSKGTIYFSDVVEKLDIDLELAVTLCKELMKEGKLSKST